MATVIAPPQPIVKRMTYAEYRAMPDGGKRREGKFHMLGRYGEGETVRSEVLAGLEFLTETVFEA